MQQHPAPVQSPVPIVPALICVLGLSAFLHARLWPIVPPDMIDYLLPWYRHIQHHGVIGAFAEPFSNYTPTYLYLLAAGSLLDGPLGSLSVIKGLSVLGTLFLALAVVDLARSAGVSQPLLVGSLVFLLPAPLLNAGLLAQCDAFWVACWLLGLAAALRKQLPIMLVWAGLAIAFKAQAAFIAPFVVGLLLRERCPWYWWLIPPAVYALAMAPAFLAGWPAQDLATVYLRQAGELAHPGSAANPWVLGRVFAPQATAALVPIGLLLGAATAAALVWWTARAPTLDLLEAALLSSLLLPFVLPKMHERYFLLADMLAFLLAFARRTRRTLLIALLVQTASLFALLSYTQTTPLLVLIGAGLNTAALLILGGGRLPAGEGRPKAIRAPAG